MNRLLHRCRAPTLRRFQESTPPPSLKAAAGCTGFSVGRFGLSCLVFKVLCPRVFGAFKVSLVFVGGDVLGFRV